MRKMQQEKDFLLDLDKTLDALLSTTISIQDPNCRLHEFVSRAFENIMGKTLKDVRRALLFLPDPRRETLIILDAHGWVDRGSESQKTFCIDLQKGNSARGVAGEAFIKRETIVAHVAMENGFPRCDKASYIPSRDSVYPFSGSLICIPILVGEEANDCLGVLCVDSYNLATFETLMVQHALHLVTRRISMLLLMSEKVKEEVVSK